MQYGIFDVQGSRLRSLLQGSLRVSILSIGVLVFAIRCSAASYYVDYSSGADGNSGTSTSSPWQHCPGDPAATGTAGSTSLNPGDTVFFKGGVHYVLTGNGNPVYQTGIGLNWSGAAGQPITYDGNSAGTWGTGRAILTDNYSTNYIAAFYNGGGANNLAFNNLEIGPIGGAASLPPDPGTGVPSNQGYGIFVVGAMNNVTIQNCYFHDLGYWFNQQPMDGNSLGGSDSRLSGGGVIFYGGTSVVITNCEFTKQHTAIEFAYSVNSSNVTIASCLFHDYIVWGIDLAGVSGNLDYTDIHDNTFRDMGWAYSPAYWTGYNYIPASCSSCFAGSPHQDPIFHRTGNANVTNGSHINIYNNTFDETHLYEVYTACIFLEYAPSANVYNNLFNIPNAGIPNGAVPSDPNGAGAPPITISYELNQPSTLRVLNNTFIVNTTANAQNAAISWGACGCLKPSSIWPANGTLQIENNLGYSFYTGDDDATLLLLGVVLNKYPVAQWTVDYNDWHSQSTSDTWFWWNNQPGFNVHGGLAAAQSVGFEAYGITNDPQFVSLAFSSSTDSVNNDYHLQPGSPAIAVGVNLSSLDLPGLNADKDGNPRPSGMWDLGAYEYNTSYVAPPPGEPPPPPQGQPGPASVSLAFSNVVQTCATKTTIDHATMTTNAVTACKVKFSLVASNTGGANSSALPILFWPGQGSVFDPSINPWPAVKRVKALGVNKTTVIKQTEKLNGNQAGTYIYATDTNNNVLASSVIPDPE